MSYLYRAVGRLGHTDEREERLPRTIVWVTLSFDLRSSISTDLHCLASWLQSVFLSSTAESWTNSLPIESVRVQTGFARGTMPF
jgi:hypothetical protein